MMLHLVKKALYIANISNLFILGHGFGPNTLVELENSSQKTIHSVCLNALHGPVFVTSYNPNNSSSIASQKIDSGKQSSTNCYIQLGFDKECNDFDDILCTPTQEFYVLKIDKWIPAYLLKPGDALLAKNNVIKTITHNSFTVIC